MSKADDGALNDKTHAKRFLKGQMPRTTCRWCESQFMYLFPWYFCPICDSVDLTPKWGGDSIVPRA